MGYNKEYEERQHELKQLQEEWSHRQEERRKTEEIQQIGEEGRGPTQEDGAAREGGGVDPGTLARTLVEEGSREGKKKEEEGPQGQEMIGTLCNHKQILSNYWM